MRFNGYGLNPNNVDTRLVIQGQITAYETQVVPIYATKFLPVTKNIRSKETSSCRFENPAHSYIPYSQHSSNASETAQLNIDRPIGTFLDTIKSINP